MKTAHTKIDVFKGTLTMEFDGEVIDFNLSETIKYPKDDHWHRIILTPWRGTLLKRPLLKE